ncbi:MAG: hypothetical protein IPG10_01575 [Flavobacteriales bacterium]|nr:hypothetical protein [Flavobacteriales bacterium]MBK6753107.1 hypothetical protein [Flavobacteriales bacterium]
METLEVDILNKRAKAILAELAALGLISVRPQKVRSLSQVIADIQRNAKKLPPLSQEEIMAEVKAVRKKSRNAASRKAQVRR